MKHLHMYIAGVCCCGASLPSYAQTSDFERALRGNAVEARVGVSIPFGGDQKKAHSKPQFALGLRRETSWPKTQDWTMRSGFEQTAVGEVKLSLTMEPSPTLLMNDRLLTFENDISAADDTAKALDNYDKTVLTVIGASLAVIAGVFVIAASSN